MSEPEPPADISGIEMERVTENRFVGVHRDPVPEPPPDMSEFTMETIRDGGMAVGPLVVMAAFVVFLLVVTLVLS